MNTISAGNELLTGALSLEDFDNPFRPGSFLDDYTLTDVIAGETVQVSLFSPDFDTYLQLLSVDTVTGEETLIEENDDANGTLNSRISFIAEANINYVVRVTSFDEQVTGSYTVFTGDVEGADLQVTDIFAPNAFVPGEATLISWTVENAGLDATASTDWFDSVYLDTGSELVFLTDVFVGSGYGGGYGGEGGGYGTSLGLNAGDSYTRSTLVTVDSDIVIDPDQAYSLVVFTDDFDEQAELSEENNGLSENIQIVVPNTDLAISATSVPTLFPFGTATDISWTVTNQGAGDATNAWTDYIYFSEDNVFDNSDTLLTSGSSQTPLASGADYTTTQSVTLPQGQIGDRYLIFRTDQFNEQLETDENNNTVIVPITIDASGANLTVTDLTAPTSTVIGEQIDVSWTVENIGELATTANGVIDYIYLSDDEFFDNSDIFLTSRFTNADFPLETGETYLVTQSLTLPGAAAVGDQFILVRTDATSRQLETNETDNVRAQAITLDAPNLTITADATPIDAAFGETLELSWTVTNNGTVTAPASWSDYVYISADDTFDNSDIFLTSLFTGSNTPLAAGDSYTVTRNVTLPSTQLGFGPGGPGGPIEVEGEGGGEIPPLNLSGGDFAALAEAVESGYLLFVADGSRSQGETDETDNVFARPVSLSAPNLTISETVVPETALIGQQLEVSWTVNNSDPDTTAFGFWTDTVYLSDDNVFDSSDTTLTNVFSGSNTPLASGDSYSVTQTIQLPDDVSGEKFLLFSADSRADQTETNEDDNIQAVAIDIGGLVVDDVTVLEGDVDTSLVQFTVTRVGFATETTTVNYATAAGTAISGTDYTATSGTLTFAPGETTKTITVEVLGDMDVERDETFSLVLSDAVGSGIADGQGIATIQKDDFLDVDLELSLLIDVSGSVDNNEYNIQVGGYASVFDDPTIYENFIARGIEGQVAVNVVLWASSDQQQESVGWTLIDSAADSQSFAQTIRETLLPASGGARPFSGGTSPGPAIDFATDLFSENEFLGRRLVMEVSGDGSGSTFATESARDNALANGVDAINGIVIGSSSSLRSFYENSVIGGINGDGSPAFVLQANSFPEFEEAAVQALISELTPPPQISVDDVSLLEGDSGTSELIFTLSLSRANTQEVTVDYATADDTATADDDYLSSSGTVTFAAGETTQTVAITINGDTTPEPDETFFLELSNPVNGDIFDGQGIGTILRDEKPDLAIVSVTLAPSAVLGEATTISWTIKNEGTEAAAANVRDRIYLSTDNALSNDDIILATELAPVLPLAPGEEYTQTESIILPLDDTFTDGDYFVITQADTLGQEDEINEDNNLDVQSISLTVPDTPDLVVSSISGPAEVISGQDIEIVWTLTNQGAAAAIGNWSDEVFLSADAAVGGDQSFGSFDFTGTLAAGESIERRQLITLPLDFEGDFFPVVRTDRGSQIVEYRAEDNNVAIADDPISVILSPIPNLQVSSITAPDTAFSSQETLVEWTVTNTGNGATSTPAWRDRVWLSLDETLDDTDVLLGDARNPSFLAAGDSYTNSLTATLPRGIDANYFFLVQTDISNQVDELGGEGDNLSAGGPTNISLTPPPDLQVTAVVPPSQAFSGQPINLNWTVTNEGPGRTLETTWYDDIYMSADDTISGDDFYLGQLIRNGALESGESYTTSGSFDLPIGIDGDFFFLVDTDSRNQVYEQAFEGNNEGASDSTVLVNLTPPPDLEVDFVEVPAIASASRELGIRYQVTNFGGTETPNSSWQDAFYLSADDQLDTDTDLLLGTRSHFGQLQPFDSYSSTATFTLADELVGDYYAFVVTDRGDAVFELASDPDNNILASDNPIAIVSRPADLSVSAFTAPAEGEAGKGIQVEWTVTNSGIGDSAVTRWGDRIVASIDDIAGNEDDLTLADFDYVGLLDSGESYTRNEIVSVPFQLAGDYNLFAITDIDGTVYEATAENNNASLAQPIAIARNTPDLQVTDLTAPATANSGTGYTVSWTVQNTGAGQTNTDTWYDAVYLSTDETLGDGDLLLDRVYHSGVLEAATGEYSVSRTFNLPIDIDGDFYTIVATDVDDDVFEAPLENNNIQVTDSTTAISLSPTPDIVIEEIAVTSPALSGQPLEITWTTANPGAATTRTWFDAFYLSRDQVFDRTTDTLLGVELQSAGDANGTFTKTRSFDIPRGLSGPFYVFGVADSTDRIYERVGEDNNITIDDSILQVDLPQPTDLVVGTITVPTNAVPGQNATITYTVENNGAESALGTWTDSIYISSDNQWDVNDQLLTEVKVTGPVASGESYSQTVSAALPGVLPGNYHAIIRSDIRNVIPESNEPNNIAASIDQTDVDAEQLEVGTPDTGTLLTGQSAYYKIDVPEGETLKLTLDSLADTSVNELYIRRNAMPTRGQFDFTVEDPFVSDPEILLPVTEAGTYYVLAYGDQAVGGGEYTISAEILPFSIESAGVDTVGDTGPVTIELKGAKFADDTVFELVDPDGDIVEARRVLVEDPSTAYVTFDLNGEDLGLYDIQAIAGNGATAILDDAITVTSGTGSSIDANLDGPQTVRPNRNYLFNVNLANSGDADVDTPLILLRSNTDTPMGLELDEITDNGLLQILGSSDGQLDTLRPGELETIPVYYNASTDPINFNVEVITSDNSRIIDWASVSESAQPLDIPDVDWNAFWDQLTSRVGTTWGDYVSLLNDLAIQYPDDSDGEPIQDVKRLFSALYADNPTYAPGSILTGTLLDSETGEAFSNIEVAAYRVVGEELLLAGVAQTDAQGNFRFTSLLEGDYEIATESTYAFDNNQDGIADVVQPTFSVTGTEDASIGDFYATIPEEPAEIIQDSDPFVTQDSSGNLHIVWSHEGQQWHAVNDGTGWFDAQPIPLAFGSDAQLLSSDTLIGGTEEGLIATWSAGEGNESEIFYAVGRMGEEGSYEWSQPNQVTNNGVYDGAYGIAITAEGTPIYVGQRENYAIEDDADLYAGEITVGDLQFIEATSDLDVLTSVAQTLPEEDIELVTQAVHRIRYGYDTGKVTIPRWVPFISGTYGAEGRLDLTGEISCTLSLAGTGELKLKIGDNGEVTGNLGGQARWTADKDTRAYKFQNARVRAGVGGAVNIPVTDWRLGPFGGIKVGPRIEASGRANVIWNAGSNFPSWPDRIEGSYRIGLGANVEGVASASFSIPFVGTVNLGEVKVTGRVIGSANFKQTASGFGFGSPRFTVTTLLRAQATVFGRKRFIDWTRTWPGSGNVDTISLSDTDTPLSASTFFNYGDDAIFDETLTFSIEEGVDDGTLINYDDASAVATTNNLYDEGVPVTATDAEGITHTAWSNQDGVVISQLENATSTWSTPEVIDGTAGLSHNGVAIAFNEEEGIAIWGSQDLNGLTNSSTQEEIIASFAEGSDLFYSVYSSTTGTWSSATSFFAADGDDYGIAIAQDTATGNIVTTWLHQTSETATTLYGAIWDDATNTWSTPEEIASGSFSGDPTLSTLGTQPIVLWTNNLDTGDNITESNQIIRQSTFDGTTWSAPTDFVYDISDSLTEAALLNAATGGLDGDLATAGDFSPSVSLPTPPEECFDDEHEPEPYEPDPVRPSDPNDILGPDGFGEEKWITTDNSLDYTIRFENQPSATAPAQEVVITQQLDDDLDWRTFRVDDFGWGDLYFDLPGNRPFYNNRIDLIEDYGFFVDVFSTIDVSTGTATWTIKTIDPETGAAPLDALEGFLPINNEDGIGEGFVAYSVQAKRSAQTGDVIDAEARIVFDTEEPIDTPPIFNTLDVGIPTSTMEALPDVIDNDTGEFLVTWSGGDDANGSGLAGYTVYVSEDGDDFTPWLADTLLTEATYTGEPGSTYDFYVIASDNAGNEQAVPTQAQSSTSIVGGTATFGDFIWLDANVNGIQDIGEDGVSGVTVNLYQGDGTFVTSTVTDVFGAYTFDGLEPGDYFAEIVTLDGYRLTDKDQGIDDAIDSDFDTTTGRTNTITLEGGEDYPTFDGGLYQVASISGEVWNDADGNRINSAAEPGLSDWTVYLDTNGNGELDTDEISTQTNVDGTYHFSDLDPGTYNVAQVVKPGWQQTFPAVTTTSANIEIFTPSAPEELTTSATVAATGSLISLDDFRADERFSDITGEGYASVIIDTGIDLNHPFFGADEDNNNIADRIVFQYDFADNDNDATDKNGHGSHVASIVGSSDSNYGGIAPGADLIALKVFKDNGSGYFSDLEKSLQWVINNATLYNIASVNLSLGDEKNWTSAAGRYGIGDELAALSAMGIVVAAAAGNNFAEFNSRPGVAYPAADPNVISVGAVEGNTGQIADFSQRHSELLDVFAPGIPILGADAEGGTKILGGTSQAAPYISGIAVLAQQIAVENLGRRLTTTEFNTLISTTGILINDGDDEVDNVTNTGLDFPQVNMVALAEAILPLSTTTPDQDNANSENNDTNDPIYVPLDTNSVGYTVTLGSGESVDDLNFGNQPLPNLVSVAFDATDDHVLLGKTDLSFTIANQGVGNAAAFSVDVIYSDDEMLGNEDDIVINTLDFGPLGAGESVDYTGLAELPLDVLNNRALVDDVTGLETGHVSSSFDYVGIMINVDTLTGDTQNAIAQGKGIDRDDITYFPWDLDNNGVITPTDAIFVINRLGQITDESNALADFDGDGLIEPTDAISAVNRLGYTINPNVFELG